MKEPFLRDASLDMEAVFASWARNPALVTPGGMLSFADLAEGLSGLRSALLDHGVRRGMRVALHEANSPLHFFLLLAGWSLGFSLVLLDPKAPAARALCGVLPDLLISREKDPGPDGVRTLSPDLFSWGAGFPRKAAPLSPVPLRREASVVFTSGSTGAPKGVVHTVGNLYYSALGTIELLGLAPGHRWLVSLPLFHVGGLLIFVRTFLSGAAAIVHGDPGRLEEAISAHAPEFLSLVPLQLSRLLGSPEAVRGLASAQAVLLGGGPCPAGLLNRALDAGIPVAPTYGSTEAASMVTAAPPGAPRREIHTAGKPLAHRELCINSDGLIVLGGKTLFRHYLAGGVEVEGAPGGRFTTTDLGALDPDGNLRVLGRSDQVFISGGENINPFEIESALAETGLVKEAAVVPAPHPEFGKTPWAFVETEGAVDEAALKAALRKILPPFKIPKRILPFPAEEEGGMKRRRKDLESLAAQLAGQGA
ncbi:MAG: AMP-binding protein [Thermodesulfobacteriota bacterium]